MTLRQRSELTALQREIRRKQERERRQTPEGRALYEAKMKRFRERNPGRIEAIKKAYRERNPDSKKREYEANKPRYLAAARARCKRVRASTPKWANPKAIRAIYAEAMKLGLVVDHDLPLKGELVCGLHVEDNLKLMLAEHNRVKSNKFEPFVIHFDEEPCDE